MKGKRTELSESDCAIARSLDVIGDWWSLLIVRDARSGKRRFSEFQKNLGLAKNILTTRLKKLVERGIMEMVPASDGSAFKEYVLTEKGEKLYVVIVALWQWGEQTCFEIETGQYASQRTMLESMIKRDLPFYASKTNVSD